MSEIRIDIDDTEFQRRTRQLLEALGPEHLPRVLNDIGQTLIDDTKALIQHGLDWQGRSFAPNTAVTLKRKRGTRPLIDSGVWLRTRLSHHVGANSVTLQAGGVQAATLHYGARKGQFGKGPKRGFLIPWGRIKARPYMPLADDGTQLVPAAEAQVIRTIEEYLAAAAR